MDKKLVMAVAGSGKTYLICNSVDPEKRNLILAFTHENIKNIHHELLERFGPSRKYNCSTFHGFLFGTAFSHTTGWFAACIKNSRSDAKA
jgi:superfamily I DNA/RNA helicase